MGPYTFLFPSFILVGLGVGMISALLPVAEYLRRRFDGHVFTGLVTLWLGIALCQLTTHLILKVEGGSLLGWGGCMILVLSSVAMMRLPFDDLVRLYRLNESSMESGGVVEKNSIFRAFESLRCLLMIWALLLAAGGIFFGYMVVIGLLAVCGCLVAYISLSWTPWLRGRIRALEASLTPSA